MHKWLAAILGTIGISACGGDVADQSKPIGTLSSFPTTIEGRLSVDVTNDAGYFGTITVGDTRYLVAIPIKVVSASGVSAFGGNVRVTIEAKEEEYAPGVPTYRVSEMKAL